MCQETEPRYRTSKNIGEIDCQIFKIQLRRINY